MKNYGCMFFTTLKQLAIPAALGGARKQLKNFLKFSLPIRVCELSRFCICPVQQLQFVEMDSAWMNYRTG